MKQRLILIMAFFACAMTMMADGWTTITNGQLWYDTDGNVVQAHAPGFLKEGNTWYMVGEDRANSWNPDVNLYASEDLQHWRFMGKIIENGVTTPELGKTRFIERAKILHNKKTGKYVVWCHWEGDNYAASEAACFVADQITGPYRLQWSGRPLGVKSRDCNVFVDNDGTAYFISTTTENTDLGLFRLSSDYLSVKKHSRLMEGQRREAPVIVRVDGLYALVGLYRMGTQPVQAKRHEEPAQGMDSLGEHRRQQGLWHTGRCHPEGGGHQANHLSLCWRPMDGSRPASHKDHHFPCFVQGRTVRL